MCVIAPCKNITLNSLLVWSYELIWSDHYIIVVFLSFDILVFNFWVASYTSEERTICSGLAIMSAFNMLLICYTLPASDVTELYKGLYLFANILVSTTSSGMSGSWWSYFNLPDYLFALLPENRLTFPLFPFIVHSLYKVSS